MNYTNKFLALVILSAFFFIQQIEAQDITTCNNRAINIEEVIVTNDAGAAIENSACTYTQGDLLGYMNCIAQNNNIPDGSSLLVELTKGDHLNGVSTLDMVLLLRDLLKVEEFDDSCAVVSADVNGDNKLNVKDIVIMRRLILGIIAELPTDSWRFFNSPEINITGIGPDTDLVYAKEDFPLTSLRIKGVKVGDVNNSVAP